MDKHRLHAVCRVINGAATSLGRVPIVLDIYAERDLARGTYTESEIQEFVDDFVMKLRTVKFARTKAYDQLYSGDPTFITTSMAGMGNDGRHRVTKMDYRFLNTLDNIGNSPEPNLTVLWTDKLPYSFRRYCMHMSHKHSSIQYEGVTTMAKDGYGEMSCISCCVSPLDPENEEQRHNIQYFGARVNVLKALLTGLNGGYDDVHKDYKVFDIDPIRDEVLEFESVKANFEKSLDWLTDTYVDALNIIHYMTDKYNYEAVQMAFLQLTNALTWDSVSVDLPILLIHCQQSNTLLLNQSVTKMATSTTTKQSVNTHVGVKMTHVLTNWQNG